MGRGMLNRSVLVSYFADMPRRHVLFLAIALCLVLGAPLTLSAQSCPRPATEGSDCDCNATINPGACSLCWSAAFGDALGCAISGNCSLANVYQRLNQCLDGMSATPPSAPTPVDAPAPPGICGGGGEIRGGHPLPLSRSLAAFSPATGSGSGAIETLDPVPLPHDEANSLLDGNAVTANREKLRTTGRAVAGIAADNAARVVLRIRVCAAGQLTIGLSDSNLPDLPATWGNLGGLYDINDPNPDNAQNKRSLNVEARQTPDGPMAFAVYRAPPGFGGAL